MLRSEQNRTVNQNNVLCSKGIILTQQLLHLSSWTFCNVKNLTPPKATFQDVSQSEVTIPIWLGRMHLHFVYLQTSLITCSISVSSSEFILASLYCNMKSMKPWWKRSLANTPCILFVVSTGENRWDVKLVEISEKWIFFY